MAALSPSNRPPLLTTLRDHAVLLGALVVAMWAIEILDRVLPIIQLDAHGIRPRTLKGLIGIAFAPFLHGDFAHLISNSLPFLILGGLVMAGGRGVFIGTTIFVIIAGGLGVWLTGAGNSNHIGASGLVFGYLGFLLSRGIVEKSFLWILLAVGVLIGYGGILYGVLPGQPGISWQGHLFGFLAGIIAAWGFFSGADNSNGDKKTAL
jgi:membrane associated rhomboid family serine protease